MVIAAGVAAAATIGAGALSASQQSKAAKKATQAQTEAADAATELQREQYYQQREDIAPWREAGGRALTQLEALSRQGLGAPFRGPQALDPRRYAFDPSRYRFTPPTPESLAQDPGYQFRLQTGQRALEGSAAARGGLLSGGALRGATEFGQQLGSQEYQQAYGRALGENQLRYGRDLAGNELRYGRDMAYNQDVYNRALQQWQLGQQQQVQRWNQLAGLAGVGQQATQYLGELGTGYAQRAGEIALQRGSAASAGQIAQGQIWSDFAQSAAGGLGSLGFGYLQSRPPSAAQAPPPQAVGYGVNPYQTSIYNAYS